MNSFVVKICLLLIISAYFLTGCSNTQKKTDAQTQTPAAATTETPAKKEEAKPKGVVCKNGVDERTIDVVKANVCEVAYTKFSNREVIATSSSSISYCEEVAQKVQRNLEAGGFTCKM